MIPKDAVRMTLIAAATLAGTPVAAQDNSNREGARVIDEVIVTARKREESLLEVPVAMTVLDAESMEIHGIKDVVDISYFTPGFSVNKTTVNRQDRGYQSFVIRQIDPGTNFESRQSVGLFVDGAPIFGGAIPGVEDIERVEVIKGPQSAYFGRATFAGAINFITRSPGFEWKGSASAELASYDTSEIIVSAEGPIVEDKLSFRIGGRSYQTGGSYDNVGYPGNKLGSRDTQSLSLSLFARPSNNLSIKLHSRIWEDSDGPPANSQLNFNYYNCNSGTAPAGTLNYFCGPIETLPIETQTQNVNVGPDVIRILTGSNIPFDADFIDQFGLEREAVQLHLIADYEFQNGFVLSANVAYDRNNWAVLTDTTFQENPQDYPNTFFGTIPDVLPYFARSALVATRNYDYSGEIRLASVQDRRLRWTAGVNYYHGVVKNATNIFGNTGFLPVGLPTYNGNDTYAVFGSIAYDLWDQWTLTVEGRFQVDEIEQDNPRVPPPVSHEFEALTPRVILEYAPRDDLNLYLSYAEGTRPGAFNRVFPPDIQALIDAILLAPAFVPEEELKMAEFGLKGRFFDDRLQILAAIYYGDWTNRHVVSPVTYFHEGVFTTVSRTFPGGRSFLDGFELEGSLQASDKLSFHGTFGVARMDIRSTVCALCGALTGNSNPVGRQPDYKSGTLSAMYEFPLARDLNGYLLADYVYTDKLYDGLVDIVWIPAGHLTQIKAGIKFERTQIEVFGTNVFDDRTPTSFSNSSHARTGTRAIVLGLADKPTYGLRVKVSF